jgi:hypothetical protein
VTHTLPAKLAGHTGQWLACYRTARRDGLAAALDTLLRPLSRVPLGPAGHALLPDTCAPTGLVTVATVTVEGRTLLAQRATRAPGDIDGDLLPWVIGLAWLRLGVSERLRAECVAHLRGRLTGGQPLLAQQLIRGGLAEVVLEHQELHAVLRDGDTETFDLHWLSHLHRQLTTTDRMLLRLFGAHGFQANGPGQVAYVSELLADLYTGSLDQDGVS